jgi:hypothetical protein
MSELLVVCTGPRAAGISPAVAPEIWTLESLEKARVEARSRDSRASRSKRPRSSFFEAGSKAVRSGFANDERPLNTRIST